MRKWLVLTAVIVLAIAGLLALAVANLDRWLNANREQVAERVEAALGRKVSFGEVGVSFRGGLGVRVADLHVGDDPAFSKEDFLSTQAADVLIRIWPALFGKIEVARVVLREPHVRVIRTQRGLSIDSLGGAKQAAPTEPGAAPSPSLLVALVDVRDGQVQYIDRTLKPPSEVSLDALDVRASDIGPGRPLQLELEAAALGSAKRNLEISGSLGPIDAAEPKIDLALSFDPVAAEQLLALPPVRPALPAGLTASGPLALEAKAQGNAKNLHFDATLDAKSAALKLGESFDKPRGVPLRLALRGTLESDALALEDADLVLGDATLKGSASLTSLAKKRGSFTLASDVLALAPFGAGEAGDELRKVEVKGTLAGDKISANLRSAAGKVRGSEYRDLVADVTLAGGRVDVEKATLHAFEGEVAASGSYDSGAAPPRFDLRTRVQKVRVEQLLAGSAPSLARLVSGQLDTKLDLRGAGSTWEQIKPLLSGSGDLRMADGVLHDFNPAGDALRVFAALPQLGGSGLGRFVSAHPQIFGAGDTKFSELATGLQIRDGWVSLPGLVIETKDYVLRGGQRGRLSLDGKLDLPIDVVLAEPLSEEAVAAAKQLRYLRASDGRVSFPLLLHGKPPVPTPDPEAVSRLALQVGTGLLTERLLGKPKGGAEAPAGAETPEATGTTPQAQPAPPAQSPEEELLRQGIQRGLEGLLGGKKRQPSQ